MNIKFWAVVHNEKFGLPSISQLIQNPATSSSGAGAHLNDNMKKTQMGHAYMTSVGRGEGALPLLDVLRRMLREGGRLVSCCRHRHKDP